MRDERRLRRAFTAVLCALAPCAAVQACGSTATAPGDARADDATTATEDVQSAPTSDVTAAGDAPDDTELARDVPTFEFDSPPSCGAQISVVDGGGPTDADADVETLCNYTFSCGIPQGVATRGCEIIAIDLDGAALDAPSLRCRLLEDQGCAADAFSPTESGAITMECFDCLSGAGGRWTAGLAKPRSAGRDATGVARYFARMAHAESASVLAFDRMRAELAGCAAPERLLRAATRAAEDEVRHARAMGALAAEHGATPAAPRIRASKKPRSLETVARENAAYGCVHETWSALLAHWQAAHAEDGATRRAFRSIARDEARHAALAWSVATWADSRLNAAARARVRAARTRAADGLRRSIAARRAADFDRAAGLPDASIALALVEGMIAALSLSPSLPS